MKIFLSWSQAPSKSAASAFRAWLPTIIQDCREEDIFMSDQLQKGEEWFAKITGTAETADLGIVFITGENEDSPWINFESGALYSRMGGKRLCPVLFRLSKADYNGPMKNYQLTSLGEREDVLQLLHTINGGLDRPLDLTILDNEFESKWPKFEAMLNEIPQAEGPAGEMAVRSTEEKIDEMLELLRNLTRHEISTSEFVANLSRSKEPIQIDPSAVFRPWFQPTQEASLADNSDFEDCDYRPVSDYDIDRLAGDTLYRTGRRIGQIVAISNDKMYVKVRGSDGEFLYFDLTSPEVTIKQF